jgi:hypothetical protein
MVDMKTHYYVMKIDEAQYWFQAGHTVRDHFQARLIHQVCQHAKGLGRSKVRIFSPSEDLQWSREFPAMPDPGE